MITFLASRTGRWARIIAGIALIVGGLAAGSTAGFIIAVIGLVPLGAGAFDLCLLAPLFGEPMRGSAIRVHRGEPSQAPLFGHRVRV
jgi:hypothetical protein